MNVQLCRIVLLLYHFVYLRYWKYLLKFLQEGSNEPTWHGYFYTALMLLAQCLEVLIMQRYFRLVTVLGMHIRTAITCAVYKKVSMSTFGVYNTISKENILDPQKAFVSLTLFNILRFPLFMFPAVASSLVQTFVSIRRLDAFLRRTELSQDSFSRESAPGIAAAIECGVFAWDSDDEPVLKNISIQFPEGQLTAIVGTVGSGKSSLLHALLADMELCSGRVSVSECGLAHDDASIGAVVRVGIDNFNELIASVLDGTIAYVPQEPWIFNATLRDNVLFTRPFEPEKYELVIRACGLGPDLATLPHGDLTEIGDKGINLSGGQKQRVRSDVSSAASDLLDGPEAQAIYESLVSLPGDTNQGRIINRFSQDVATVDVALVLSMQNALRCLIQCTLTLGMACAVNAWSIVPIFCLTVFYVSILNIYVSNSRQLKRIESVTRSPIFSHFSETLTGVNCIRAYGLTGKYTQINECRLDTNNRATYTGIISQRWLAVLLESVGNSVVLCVALFAVSARGQFSAGLTGLIISYALSLSQSLNFFVRMMAELESNIVCVERIDEYSRIEQEIGIVGRTGSGKSSLVMALFRMLEATEGQIKIDGIDISKVGLHDLRNRLTLIPQDPVLFSGTLRFNLDPFGEHSDGQLWDALELAHMKGFVSEAGSGLGLDMVISEGGSNFSMGQRQLVCLARALLRRTRILVLDEATAAVDPITDNLIQTTIRTSFPQCTVLTIAHRLNTILDYDRVVVMHAGQIIETGSPCELLQKKDGNFYALAKDAHLVK
ncbi:Multidrug resistance-associated protein 1 [Fasciolopsis buskii]|uniref:Multidrug resistance-associated protein 1 n=1 Tax=Fasciolopsis buskii TaxID=27845 RepID=A0A8E0VH12_9TREM|nr:Multidrug resistance-associated protein 1 [Fasciolopsis buski]